MLVEDTGCEAYFANTLICSIVGLDPYQSNSTENLGFLVEMKFETHMMEVTISIPEQNNNSERPLNGGDALSISNPDDDEIPNNLVIFRIQPDIILNQDLLDETELTIIIEYKDGTHKIEHHTFAEQDFLGQEFIRAILSSPEIMESHQRVFPNSS